MMEKGGPQSKEFSKKVELLNQLLRQKGIAVSHQAIAPANLQRSPLSFAQQWIWVIDQLLGESSSIYNVHFALRMKGAVDVGAMQRSLSEVVRRHQALRMRFSTVDDGVPVQEVIENFELALPVEDLTSVAPEEREKQMQLRVHEVVTQRFNLQEGGLLLRARLLRLGEREHVAVLVMHHIVSDAWSTGILVEEFTELYRAEVEGRVAALKALRIQYADYAAWQRKWLQGEELERQLNYWRNTLKGVPQLIDLPGDRPRPAASTHRGAIHTMDLGPELTAGLKRMSRDESATLFMVLLAAFNVLLRRWTGQMDFVVGTPVGNRNREEIEGLIGFFVNTLALRTRISGEETFREVLRQARQVVLDANAHQDLPFEKLVAELQPDRNLSTTPLFQVIFGLQNTPRNTADLLRLPGLTIEEVDVMPDGAKFDLELSLVELPQGLGASLGYSTDLFELPTILRLGEHYRRLLGSIIDNPAIPVWQVPLLDEAERTQLLVEFNRAGGPHPSARQTLLRALENATRRFSLRAAVALKDQTLSYEELDRRSNQLARYLRKRGAGPEAKIGVCMDRTPTLVVALLAILKAGAVYVPLDPRYPIERLEYFVEDSGVRMVITDSDRRDRLRGNTVAQLVLVDQEMPDIARESTRKLKNSVYETNLAYLIYTSGSTGLPKGAMIDHRGLINHLWAKVIDLQITEDDVVAQSAPSSFDISVWQILTPLLVGGRVEIIEDEVAYNGTNLMPQAEQRGVTILETVPSLLKIMLESGQDAIWSFRRLRIVLCQAEPLGTDLCRRWWEQFPDVCLLNAYGVTECSDDATHYDFGEGQAREENLRDLTYAPLGHVLSGMSVYILDERMSPVPVGVKGEVYIAGKGVGRGYSGHPALTAEKFLPNPFSRKGGERFYRTGDIARYRRNGDIESLGRTDHQVKIRGQRVELGEIEAALREHPWLQDAVVLVRNENHAGPRLVAWIVPRLSESYPEVGIPSDAELREFLGAKLPDYMVPVAYVAIPGLPVTPSGKVDRQALHDLDVGGDVAVQQDYVAPRTAIEEVLAGIWADVLGKERVGIRDNFFEMGGHSLLATQVISRVSRAFSREIGLRALFEGATVEELGRRIEEALMGGDEQASLSRRIQPRTSSGNIPLSFAQERLWFLDRLEEKSATYHIAAAVRLEGELNAPALERTLQTIVRRHEALRTQFRPGDDGRPVQEVLDAMAMTLPVSDVSGIEDVRRQLEIEQLIELEARAPFDLSQAPLLRARLLKAGEREHVAVLVMHHIVSDGWSMGILIREISEAYAAEAAGREVEMKPLPLQYPDYAAWQREWLRGEVLERQLTYWRRQFEGASGVLELPVDYSRPAVASHRGAAETFVIGEELTASLKKAARAENVTLFMLLLAALQATLYRWTGQDDVVVGTPVANRNHEDIEGLIGFFVNTLAIRSRVNVEQTPRELLQHVRETTLQAYMHQDFPFEKLVEELQPERDLARTPLFQVMFLLQNTGEESLMLPGLRLTPMGVDTGTAKFDLTLAVTDHDTTFFAGLEYAADLFDASTIQQLGGLYLRALEGIVAHPTRRLSELPWLSEADREQVRRWNATARQFEHAGGDLVQLLEDAFNRHPGETAVIFEGVRWTYAELDSRTNQLAHHLRNRGVGPDVRVGVCLERSLGMVASLVAILKAGGAYVPMDPEYPRERLEFIAEDADVRVIVSESRLMGNLPTRTSADQVLLDEESAEIEQQETRRPESGVDPDNLAYVIYTSGSTGNPKGAMVSHGAICNRLLWMQAEYQLSPRDRVLQKTPFSFDVSVWEFFWTLMTGAGLVVARPRGHQDAAYLCETIGKMLITVVHFVPSMLRAFLLDDSAGLWSLRYVMCSGEALPVELKNLCLERLPAQLHNLYGPTEAAVDVTHWRCSPADRVVPIGRPIANIQIHILDHYFSEVPTGVHGQLYIAGTGLGRGYAGRGDLTAESFLPNPFGGPGSRLYRTGDVARRRPDGSLEFLGRKDDQVKIRGFRIELAEISSCLKLHPSVEDAVAIVREDRPNERTLVAYVVPSGRDVAGLAEELRSFARDRLPEYMVPWHIVFLDMLPLTSNGKLDRRSLPGPQMNRGAGGLTAPSTPTEAVIAGVWQEVMGVSEVGVHDNFFELGGDSIRSVQIIALAKKRGLDISLQQMFRYQTIAELAKVPGVNKTAAIPPQTRPFELMAAADLAALPEGIEDAYPLTRMQAGMLYHMQLAPGSPVYHNVDTIYLEAPFDFDAMRRSFQAVVDRHPNLRTAFHLNGYSEPLQLVHARAQASVGLTDVRHLSEDLQQMAIEDFIRQEQQAPRFFDIQAPPLLRLHVHWRGENRYQLTFTENHAIQDGWSLHSTFEEIFDNYLALVKRGELPKRPPLTSTYRDFVKLERDALESEECRSYWRNKIEGHRTLSLPRTESENVSGLHDTYWVEIPDEVSTGLRDLSRRAAAPVKSVLLAAHMKVLSLLSGDRDVMTGVSTHGRMEEGDSTEVRGLFLNTAPLRLLLGGGSWQELVKAVFAAEWQMLPYRRYPLAEIQKNWGSEGMVDINFLYTHFHVVDGLLRSGEIKVLDFKSSNPTSLALVPHFFLDWTTAAVRLNLVYDPQRFSADQMKRIAGYYYRALHAMATDSAVAHGSVDLLSSQERHQLLMEWNKAENVQAACPCVHELVEEQVARHGEEPAVVFGDEVLSFRELDRRANQLARYLMKAGVGPEMRVGVFLERTPFMVTAVLGVLKSGGAYVPMSPEYPAARLSHILEDAQIQILLTTSRLRDRLPSSFVQEICLDTSWDDIAAESEERMESGVSAENLAYVIYTSGSTGQPKGVMIPHRGVSNYLRWCRAHYRIEEGSGAPVHSPLEFDLTVTSLWGPLISGRMAVLVPEADGVEGLGKELASRKGFSLVKLTPAHLDVLQHTLMDVPVADSANAMIIGGEALYGEKLDFWRRTAPRSRLINEYGPTETVVGCCVYEAPGDRPLKHSVPIGNPITNARMYILNSELALMPSGMTGEIYIGGTCVGRGYLNQPALTAEKFVPDPYGAVEGGRLYRTGDRGRYLDDGNLDCLGRVDYQVKIRGYRIELGEIEQAIKGCNGVDDAVVLVKGEAEQEKHLMAIVVPQEGQEINDRQVRDYMRGNLPEYMVPAVYVTMKDLPLTANGKVDRKALLNVSASAGGRTIQGARYGAEARMLQIWKEVLEVPDIGINDNFFELGGHSLAALRGIALIQARFGVDLPLSAFWETRTVNTMAAAVVQMITNAPSPTRHLVPLRTTGKNPPLFFVHPVGGNVFSFNSLVENLGPNQPFYGLQSIDDDSPEITIEQLAAEYLAEVENFYPTGPYLLGGWSFGGSLAYEMAVQLTRRGKEVALLAVVDREAPRGNEGDMDAVTLARSVEDIYRLQVPLEIDEPYLATLGPDEQLAYILERGRLAGVIPEGISTERAMGLLRNLRNRINANRRYAPSVYPGRITLFWHLLEGDTPEEDVTHGWGPLTSEPIELHLVEGSHFNLLEEPYVRDLAQKLVGCIAEIKPAPSQTGVWAPK